MTITAPIVEAFLKCPTKCYLRSLGEVGTENAYANWARAQNESYHHDGIKRLTAGAAPGECIIGSVDTTNLKKAKWRLVTDYVAHAQNLESCVHAVERFPSERRGKPAQFIPIRFFFTKKLNRFDKLLLAFDALVLSEILGREVGIGKIIHGGDQAELDVKTSALTNEIRKLTAKIVALLSSDSPPDLVLNRHCVECEFRGRCRQKAVEKDDLSLLSGMTEKERKSFNTKGIFTVTQLSYMFRPRRKFKRLAGSHEKYHHSLKALAIRDRKIYMVGNPELKIEGTPVYLDVEGLPDRDFYYLIGLRVKTVRGFEQHSLWADTLDQERRIWADFLGVLSRIDNPVLIHYGRYESLFLKQMCDRYGEPSKGLVEAKIIDKTLNLLSIVFARVYFPTYSNGLKDNSSFVGAHWQSPDPNGLHTILWRSEWERTHLISLKDQLIAYNRDDCAALGLLAEELGKLGRESKSRADVDFAQTPKQTGTEHSAEIHHTFEGLLRSSHSNYSEKRMRFRALRTQTGTDSKKQTTRRVRKKCKLSTRKGRLVRVPRKRICPKHPTQELMPSREIAEHAFLDIAFTRNGCRKVVVRYVGKRAYCPLCDETYPPSVVKRLQNQVYGPGLQAWAVYQRVALRLSYHLIKQAAHDLLHVDMAPCSIKWCVERRSEEYAYTEKLLLRRILESPVIHVDETKISIHGFQQFVWVMTDGSHVIFRLTETRETHFLKQLLAGYNGTLVSDFYAGYDSIPCRQQKCLAHLIRDLNDDLWENPFNAEYEEFVSSVRDLLAPIITDIRRFGLKALHLRKYQKDVEHFYRDIISGHPVQHEITAKYQKRFERYRNSVFCFLSADGIPWNNNAAERALRHLAVQRKISGAFSRKGASHYLRLLAIAQTCRFQKKSFLRFLSSGCVDVDKYNKGCRRRTMQQMGTTGGE
jgi:predicted RecB family nuclease